jgi:predicted nuclease of predicted toxin-antitoxin system
MKFLVDAQLPHRLSQWLQAEGHDSIHTQDLPGGNRTGDTAINDLSMREQRTVITKDEDFVDAFLLRHQPYKLLLVSTGNISNKELEQLFRTNVESIVKAFESHDFVELDRTRMTFHS